MQNLNAFFQLLHQNPQHSYSRELRQISLNPKDLMSLQQLQSLNPLLTKILNQIFTQQSLPKKLSIPSLIKQFPTKQTAMPLCNKILDLTQSVFRCYDCMTHQASVICKSCFQNGNHKGHRYNQISSGGGNCDCGNPDAIKQQGFCTQHLGKAKPVKLTQQDQNHFIQWMFRLYEMEKKKSCDDVGQVVSDYLLRINEKSLYYNTLTYKLLFSQRCYSKRQQKRETLVIQSLFQLGIKCINFARKLTDIFLNMFSLQIFKYKLTISYTNAYNTLQNFQKSKFKSLFIQLYANNDIVQKIIQQQGLLLEPYAKKYDWVEFMETVMFISSIRKDVVRKYFCLMMSKYAIRFDLLNQIQIKVQKGQQHIISIINLNLNNQNYYYTLHQTILKSIKDDKPVLIKMLINYSCILMNSNHSYQQNLVINPYPKILSMILVCLYPNGLPSHKQLNQLIQQFQLTFTMSQVLRKCFKLIMPCLELLAKTFVESSYFDNYVPLYIKSGNMIVIYDMLMIQMVLAIVQDQQIINQSLANIFHIHQKSDVAVNNVKTQNDQQHSVYKMQIQPKVVNNQILQAQDLNSGQIFNGDIQQQWSDEQTIPKQIQQILISQSPLIISQLKRSINLLSLLLQSCISLRFNLLISNDLCLQSPKLQTQTINQLGCLVRNFKQFTTGQYKDVITTFVGIKKDREDVQQGIGEVLVFDKMRKKFMVNYQSQVVRNASRMPLKYHKTLQKFGGIFAVENKQNQKQAQSQYNYQISPFNLKNLKTLFNETFLKKLIQHFLKNLHNLIKTCQQIQGTFCDFYQTMLSIQRFMGPKPSFMIKQLFKTCEQLSKMSQFQFLGKKLEERFGAMQKKDKHDIVMKKFAKKKNKRLEEIKKKQQSFDQHMHQEKQENLDSCIICRENKQNTGLCYLANFSYSNMFQVMNNAQGKSLVFTSCFHPIHFLCYLHKIQQDVQMPCPLCKTISNIIIPCQKQIQNKQLVNLLYQRIRNFQGMFQNQSKYIQVFTDNSILFIIRAITAAIGRQIMKNQQILDQRSQRLYNIIFIMAQSVFKNNFKEQSVEQAIKTIKAHIQKMKYYMTTLKQEQFNYYAFEYLSISIFCYCLVNQGDKCIQIVQQKELRQFLRAQEIRVTWQMCQQLLSLPQWLLPKQSQPIPKDYKFYMPPITIKQLIHLRDDQNHVCKNGHQMCICIICKVKCCYDCKQVQSHFKQEHFGGGLVFNLLTGGFFFIKQGKTTIVPSFYVNSIGISWKPAKAGDKFYFDSPTYNQVRASILNESLERYLKSKFPDLNKSNLPWLNMGG